MQIHRLGKCWPCGQSTIAARIQVVVPHPKRSFKNAAFNTPVLWHTNADRISTVLLLLESESMAIASESQADPSERGVSKAEVDNILDNNLTEHFELLRGTPGYCLETLTWETAKSLIREGTEQSLGKLGRHPASCVIYRQFRRKVRFEMCTHMSSCKQTAMPLLCIVPVSTNRTDFIAYCPQTMLDPGQ